MNTSNEAPMVIWRLTDGKPGHQSQSAGLVNALKQKTHCLSIDIPIKGRFKPLFDLFSATWPAGQGLPMPDLIIGAGHRTHLHMLAARKVYGGRAVVLMQPSLPLSWFDLSLVPAHDQYRGKGSVLETRGVLNTIEAHGEHQPSQSLIMIGGPSKHFDWKPHELLSQLSQLSKQNPELSYTLTTSRRTPAEFTSALAAMNLANMTIVPVAETEPGWVAQKLADSASAWITEDSVSMVYEALTAQVAVGVLSMPIKRDNRVSRGVNTLIEEGLVVRFDSLGHYKKGFKPVLGFLESDRCANWILHRWLQPTRVTTGQTVPQTA